MELKEVSAHYICVNCRRQFIQQYDPKGYSEQIKQECLKMYTNGLGFRAIEREIAGGIIPPATLSRVLGVHHTTIIGLSN